MRIPIKVVGRKKPRNPNLSNDYLDYLGEYETICEAALAPESELYVGLFYGKTEGQKSRDTVPLRVVKNRYKTRYKL
jgi:hypothetical protein